MTAQEFIFDTPLYQKVSLNTENAFLDDIKKKGAKIEGYNPIQKKESTFIVIKGLADFYQRPSLTSVIIPIKQFDSYSSNYCYDLSSSFIVLQCTRYDDLFYIYTAYDNDSNTIMKIGQYPSVADFHIGRLKKYTKVISKGQLKEFTRAIGLAANGVGIGSFVYLRRIFESLIFDVGNKAIAEGKIDKVAFDKCHVDEKIGMLKNDLPSFLCQNTSIYKVLSAGIHELSEEECLGYFDVLRVSIELILDEKLEVLQKAEKAHKAEVALSSIVSNIKKENDNK